MSTAADNLWVIVWIGAAGFAAMTSCTYDFDVPFSETPTSSGTSTTTTSTGTSSGSGGTGGGGGTAGSGGTASGTAGAGGSGGTASGTAGAGGAGGSASGTAGSGGSGGGGGGGCVSTLPFVEGFSSWTPTGWSVVDGGSASGDSWLQCTPNSSPICNDYPFGLSDGAFAAIDADYYGEDEHLIESLGTPSIDCSCDSSVVLEFDHLLDVEDGEHGDVDVSIGGGPWTTVASYSSNTSPNGAHVLLDLSAWAANQADVRIRFLYDETNDWGYTWMIDDVSVHP